MGQLRDQLDIGAIAQEAVATLGSGRQIAPFSARNPAFTLEDAYRAGHTARKLRQARGEKPIGRKIGFTNRKVWASFGIAAPIWSSVYDTTVRDIGGEAAAFSLAGLTEPRIEPEIVFHLSAAPDPAMDERDLLGCIDWVALGFEIVQSMFAGWKFTAADAVAAFGVHSALLVGPRHLIAGDSAKWLDTLSNFSIDLIRDGAVVDTGHAKDVLDGPLSALEHLVGVLAGDPASPPLEAGEVVTTGTLTAAPPALAGETWSTRLSGIAISDVRLRLE